ncbi:hypothetical protein cce_4467 [Crocosphaera subtropica ATCC 51142]|uniref:CopG-like ribbon-helix-helix domain-containing protein n=1 Tax=Crocosphaera subtropica (strain ATCC 51142 / BH68) TaxID=43989 RepID=B1WUG1_CROS5|nr:hypothetical protein [Crocosphaera subtropica]ACB53815.1 hypothetical protein cce_4467 [Crocosphaera subtropica ATCC 51142]
MEINIEIPKELEQELSQEASQINLSLSDYILHLLSARKVLNETPKTGKDLIAYWQQEGLINCRSDIKDSQEYARQIRYEAEHRHQI